MTRKSHAPTPVSVAAPSCRLYLSGGFRLERDGEPVQLPFRKNEALLAYLALHPQRHSREKIAAVFWGDSTDQDARRSLRVALTKIRQAAGADLVLADRAVLQINPAMHVWLDIGNLARIARKVLRNEEVETQDLLAAVNEYRGDLLADFYDDWISLPREEYRQAYLAALLQLVERAREKSEYARAIDYARKALATDPANEPAHQHLIFSYAALGDRTAALEQYETCRRLLDEELGVEPSPETRSLAEVIRKQTVTESPAARHTNLPRPRTSFIGRDREFADLKERIKNGVVGPKVAEAASSRILTLTGAGGSGKTRLAIELGHALVDAYADGVWFVDLAPLTDGLRVPHQVAQALGVREKPRQAITETLREHLRLKCALILLDNCEHVIEHAARLVDDLSPHCPRLAWLATSREALNVEGEQIYPVLTLAFPPEAMHPPHPAINDLMRYEAIRLFVDRAGLHDPAFQLTDRNLLHVARICRRLDGIPLALELAAARLQAMPVEQIAAHLDDRLKLLTGGLRTALPRHQTLHALFDWSYDLLAPQERRLFARLAVFVGGFTLQIVEGVCADEALPRPSILDLLLRLVNKSLVRSPSDETGRYGLLETIHEYAWGKLDDVERKANRERHFAYFIQLAEEAESMLKGAEQAKWLDRLEIEHDNLRAALRWGLEAAETGDHGLRLAVALSSFWEVRGYLSEGRYWLEQALASHPNAALPLRGMALDRTSTLTYRQGDYGAAWELNQKSLSIWQHLEEDQAVARTLKRLGAIAYDQADNTSARSFLEQSLELAHEAGDAPNIAASLNILGLVATAQGEYGEAIRFYEECLRIFRSLGDNSMVGMVLNNLGLTATQQADYTSARSFLNQSLAKFREIGHRWGTALALLNLGNVARSQTDLASAQAYYQESLALYQELGDPVTASYAIFGLGDVAYLHGNYASARSLFRESLSLRIHAGEKRPIPRNLEGIAQVDRVEGQAIRAARLFGAAEALRQSLGEALTQDNLPEYEREVSALRLALGEMAFEQAWAIGRTLTMEQAYELALN